MGLYLGYLMHHGIINSMLFVVTFLGVASHRVLQGACLSDSWPKVQCKGLRIAIMGLSRNTQQPTEPYLDILELSGSYLMMLAMLAIHGKSKCQRWNLGLARTWCVLLCFILVPVVIF